MSKMAVLIRKEILEQWRTKKTLILCIIFLFVAIASPVIAKLTPELLKNISVPGLSINLPDPTYKDALDQFIKNISQIALLVLVFVIAGIVSDEKSKKTLEIILTKPISRAKFILSKFFSSFLSIAVVFMTASTIFYAYTASIFSTFNLADFYLMALIVLIYILMIVSITIFASTVVKNSILAGGIGLISLILLGTISGLFENIKKFSPDVIFSNYQSIEANGWNNDLIYPIIIALSVIAISITASVLIFKRQEIER